MNDSPNRVTAVIEGTKVILVKDGPDAQTKSRLGSVRIHFDDGHHDLIRVYGRIKEYATREEKIQFEKELRRFAEQPDTIQKLFNTDMPAHSRRFNPSETLICRGWRGNAIQVRAAS